MLILWFTLASLLIIYLLTRYSRKGRLCSKLPGPTAYPLLGNILMFINCDRCELWRTVRENVQKHYPSVSRFWLFTEPILNICHPNDLEILLSSPKCIEKRFLYNYLEPWLETGLLTSSGEKWRHRRKILTPAFHFGISKKYMDIVTEQSEKMVESLKVEVTDTVKEILPFFSDYTLNIICESAMGVALDKLDPEVLDQYKQSVHDMSEVVMYRVIRPYLINSIFPYVPKMGPMQTKALKILHDFTNKVVQERREYHKNEGDKFIDECNKSSDGRIYDDSELGTKKRLAMLDLLLAGEKKGLIDNAGVKEEVDTFVLEGHDTTSTALTFTVLLLAENKEVQGRARQEVTRIMDAANGKAGVAEVQEFQYLERCIKESLRLFPPVPNMSRYVEEDLQLKHTLIPANTNVLIHIWDAHRDANYWPDPDKFDPDRFLPEHSRDRHPFAYLPFSAGPRNCIGQKFAMMELKSMIAYILYDFYIEPIDRLADVSLVVDLLIRPFTPVRAKFVKINK